MFKPLSFFVGLRYTRAKRRNGFISFITLVSALGTALGVTVLITVFSVMNGFEAELRERILGMTAHASVTGPDGRLSDWRELERPLGEEKRVVGWAPYTEAHTMLNADRQVSGATVRGILPDYESRVSEVTSRLTEGRSEPLRPGQFGIILGDELAKHLGAKLGDKIAVITSEVIATPAGVMPRLKRFTVVGTFRVGMYEYDRNLALIHLDDAGRLFHLEGKVSGLRLKLDDALYSRQVVENIESKLERPYLITDWTRAHANIFKAIQSQKHMMFVILFLIVAVAAFNIISTLVMIVAEKRGDIAILRTQGMTPLDIMAIFVTLGTVIGLFGSVLGGIGGVLLAWNVVTIVPAVEHLLGIKFLSADVYYISELPSKLIWSEVYSISGMAFLLSILATIYPAWQASLIAPAEELRYE